jgi:hypothetical protein
MTMKYDNDVSQYWTIKYLLVKYNHDIHIDNANNDIDMTKI